MMKYVFALVLLHFCHCGRSAAIQQNSDPNEKCENPNIEMFNRLKELNDSDVNKNLSFKPNTTLKVPGDFMVKHPSSCKAAFKTALRELLQSVVGHTDTIKALKGNLDELDELDGSGQHDSRCSIMPRRSDEADSVFHSYINFVSKLNNGVKTVC